MAHGDQATKMVMILNGQVSKAGIYLGKDKESLVILEL